MFRIENDKLVNENVSFKLPQGFYLDLSEDFISDNFIKFVSDYGRLGNERMTIEIETICAPDSKDRVGAEQYMRGRLESIYGEDGFEIIDATQHIRGGSEFDIFFYQDTQERANGYSEVYKIKDRGNGEYLLEISLNVINLKGEQVSDIYDVIRLDQVFKFFQNVIYLK